MTRLIKAASALLAQWDGTSDAINPVELWEELRAAVRAETSHTADGMGPCGCSECEEDRHASLIASRPV